MSRVELQFKVIPRWFRLLVFPVLQVSEQTSDLLLLSGDLEVIKCYLMGASFFFFLKRDVCELVCWTYFRQWTVKS